MRITCRYCPFYAPDVATPIIGHCGYCVPPRFVELPNVDCPLGNNPDAIGAAARYKGFEDHDLRSIMFMVSGAPQLYHTIRGLKKDYPDADRVQAIYIDADGIVFFRSVAQLDGTEGVLSV